MPEKVNCYHRGDLSNAPSASRLVKTGQLTTSNDNGICDWRVPIAKNQASGQDIACVGPNNSECPDPKSATTIP
jgi:hypothetical protein